jgi:signal transduction histidine kinase
MSDARWRASCTTNSGRTTAILAFANTIECASDAQEASNGIKHDARMISQAALRIMACLRDTLKRLRQPAAEELGLEESLVNLVESWRSQGAARPTVQLDMQGDFADVRGAIASTAYRVAQECLTNALRHSAAREISLRIERRGGEEDTLLICVEDDGGGDAAHVAQSTGFGLTGMRERIAAVGGSLSIARATRGLSVAATIPLAA